MTSTSAYRSWWPLRQSKWPLYMIPDELEADDLTDAERRELLCGGSITPSGGVGVISQQSVGSVLRGEPSMWRGPKSPHNYSTAPIPFADGEPFRERVNDALLKMVARRKARDRHLKQMARRRDEVRRAWEEAETRARAEAELSLATERAEALSMFERCHRLLSKAANKERIRLDPEGKRTFLMYRGVDYPVMNALELDPARPKHRKSYAAMYLRRELRTALVQKEREVMARFGP